MKLAIAEDSGFCVDALGGAPGIYSACWADRHGDYNFNKEQLLKRMEYIPDSKQTAHFHSTVVFLVPSRSRQTTVSLELDGRKT